MRLLNYNFQVIFIMKWISFVHENAYKVLHPWHKDDETGLHTCTQKHTHTHHVHTHTHTHTHTPPITHVGPAVWYAGQMDPQIGSFSSYVYFLFCPVFLYRDRYPRKPPNFKKASAYFLQVHMYGHTIYYNSHE